MAKSVSKFRKNKVYADDYNERYSEKEQIKRSKPRDEYRPIKAYEVLEQLWNETETRKYRN